MKAKYQLQQIKDSKWFELGWARRTLRETNRLNKTHARGRLGRRG
jgi:hypothetical protein